MASWPGIAFVVVDRLAQTPCDQIKSLAFPDTVITSAEVVAADPTNRPRSPARAARLNLPPTAASPRF